MPSPMSPRPDASSEPEPEITPDDVRRALFLAQERYTAAKRQYTSLYVESQSGKTQTPEHESAMLAAREMTISLAAALRQVEDGEAHAVRRELSAGPVAAEERALTTDRFTIAELRAAEAWDNSDGQAPEDC